MEASTPAPAPIPRRDLLPLLLLAAGVSIYWLTLELRALGGQFGFPLDDSWIHLSFARSLAEGDGLAVNPGELVAASTSPLWTALLSLIFAGLPGNPFLWTKVFGMLAHGGTVVTAWRLAVELGLSRGLSFLAGLLTLSTGWLAWSASSGMEIPLFALLSLLGLLLAAWERREPERPPLSFAVFGLSALARPEGFLLVVIAAIDRLLVFRRAGSAAPEWQRPDRPALGRLAAGLALAALPVLPVMVFNWSVGGTPLPSTYVAKTGYGSLSLLPNLQYLYTVLGILFRPLPWATLLAGAGTLALAARRGTTADRGLLLVGWVVGLPLAYSLLPAPVAGNFGRYFFPLMPALAVLGCVALAAAAESLRTAARPALGRLVMLVAGGLMWWPTAATLPAEARLFAQNVRNVNDSDLEVIRQLAGRLPPEAVVALSDLGAFSFFFPNHILDVGAIATPEVAVYANRAASEGRGFPIGVFEYLAEKRPDYLLTFPSWLPPDERQYPRVLTIKVPGNVTMAGDELVLYATPWTRYPIGPPVAPEATKETPSP